MFDHTFYTRKWIAAAKNGFLPNNDAASYGVTVEKATQPSEYYWRVIGVRHLTGFENNGNHHIYCDVLDTNGNRANGARLHISTSHTAIIDKPENEPGTNFPMWSDRPVSVRVDWPVNGLAVPSDVVSGMHFGWPDEDQGNTWGHHSFFCVFQLMKAKSSQPTPLPPSQPPEVNWHDFSGQAARDGGDILLRIPRDVVAPQQTRIIRWPEVV